MNLKVASHHPFQLGKNLLLAFAIAVLFGLLDYNYSARKTVWIEPQSFTIQDFTYRYVLTHQLWSEELDSVYIAEQRQRALASFFGKDINLIFLSELRHFILLSLGRYMP